jgi:uncharacterized protein
MQQEFKDLIMPYFSNQDYLQLAQYEHHNTTRLNHLYNVAVYSYFIGRKLRRFCKIDLNALLAGALLHDFHFVKKHEYKLQHCRNTHGKIASANADNVFHISEKEKNIIEAHMFPLVAVLPKSPEAWIVSFSDKFSAFMEACFRKNHAIPFQIPTC